MIWVTYFSIKSSEKVTNSSGIIGDGNFHGKARFGAFLSERREKWGSEEVGILGIITF